jgi:hypothetical protein
MTWQQERQAHPAVFTVPPTGDRLPLDIRTPLDPNVEVRHDGRERGAKGRSEPEQGINGECRANLGRRPPVEWC